MSFRDNLLYLRASNNMTQEQLAMLLGVSRQSVTKWESEKSYPEMDKLLKMCQLFNCTLDELVQGDMTKHEMVEAPNGEDRSSAKSGMPAVDVFDYDAFMRRFAKKISYGVASVILGVAISLLFFGAAQSEAVNPLLSLPDNIAAAIGCMFVFLGVAACLALIIPAGMEHASFVRKHPFIEDFYTEEQKDQARRAFTYQLVSGIVIILVGICFTVLISGNEDNVIGPAIQLVLVAVGVGLIIHGSMTLGRTNISMYNLKAAEVLEAHEIAQMPIPQAEKEEMMRYKKSDARIGAICGTIMLVATIAGLVMLFVPDYFNAYFWLAWPIGGILCGIVAMLMKAFGKESE